LPRDQLLRKRLISTRIRSCKASLNVDGAAIHPTKAGEPLAKFGKLAITFLVVFGRFLQHADPPHAFSRQLRARRDRPPRRAAEQRDELASPDHSITSSAATSSVCGTVRPSIRAVERLMTSSNFDDCTTGRSAGFAPLRTWLT
jgi:hypothetical protein